MDTRTQIGRDIESGSVIGDMDGEVLEEDDVLGYVVWATTGDVIVERDWLIEKFGQFERGERLLPNKKWPSSAYKIAMRRLINNENDEARVNGYEVNFRVMDGDTGNYKHLMADVMIPEEESGEDGGMIRSRKLITFNYDADAQSPVWNIKVDESHEELHHKAVCLGNRAMQIWRQMKESHDGQDLRSVFYKLRDEESHAIPLRHGGAVYFFPKRYQDTVNGLSAVWDQLNQWKDGGHECEIGNIKLADEDGYREMVHRHAERMLEKQVADSIENGVDRLLHEEEDTADEIAQDIVDELSESRDMAEEYSELLNIKLSVKRHLEEWLGEMSGESQDLVEEVLESDEIEL